MIHQLSNEREFSTTSNPTSTCASLQWNLIGRHRVPVIESSVARGYYIGNKHFISRSFATSSSGNDQSKTQHTTESNAAKKQVNVKTSVNEGSTQNSAVTDMSDIKALRLPDPDLAWEYILNPDNEETIKRNTEDRKGVGDLQKVVLISL